MADVTKPDTQRLCEQFCMWAVPPPQSYVLVLPGQDIKGTLSEKLPCVTIVQVAV